MGITTIERHQLSKTTFMYGCQCHKRLWLHKFRPDLRDEETEQQAAIFQAGTDIGKMAQNLFPGGVDASPEPPYLYQQSVVKTQELIRNGAKLIYEAAFQFDGILAVMDILVKRGSNWYAFEVKGTGSVKDQHIQDAALQYFVITGSGFDLKDISILHLNTSYIRNGALDLNRLFTPTSVLDGVRAMQPEIAVKVKELKNVLKLKSTPDITIGDHCFKPYDCDFYGYCSMGLKEKEEDHGTEYINRKAIRDFIGQLEYPLHFLDFETWMSAVPEQDGHWPFRQIPFQYSLHIQASKRSESAHRNYLADGPHTTHREFAESLVQAIEKKGTVLVYNKSFENTILNNLKKEFEDLSEPITRIQDRIIDLMTPFRKDFRLPAMKGSWSIKAVLPALVPDLSYKGMVIGNGGDASAAFYNLKHVHDEAEKEKTRKALLEYCGMDTWGMVKILETLHVNTYNK